MRVGVLLMAADLLGQAVEHYREAIIPPSGAAPATAPATAPTEAKSSKPGNAVQPVVVH